MEDEGKTMKSYNTDEPRYWYLDITQKDHGKDLSKSLNNNDLFGIVDEEDGGIIAYAIGEEHANKIIKALKELPMRSCAACNGTGHIPHAVYPNEMCDNCRGIGQVPR